MKNIPLLSSKRILTQLFCTLLFFLSVNQVFGQEYKIKTIVLDAGHGGKDGTTKGAYSTEKEVALNTTLRLGKAIENALPNVKVLYTRIDDTFVPLYERIAIANNAHADIFISIHCNDMPLVAKRVIARYTTNKAGKRVPVYKTTYSKNRNVKGTETFVSGSGRLDEQDEAIKRENASIFLEDNYEQNYAGFGKDDVENQIVLSLMKNAFRVQSLNLALLMQDEYVKVGRVNRGVQEKSLAVLARAGMPAVLTEIGFLSNPEEEDYMNSEEGQQEIVNCLLQAIIAYKTKVEI